MVYTAPTFPNLKKAFLLFFLHNCEYNVYKNNIQFDTCIPDSWSIFKKTWIYKLLNDIYINSKLR